MKKLFENSQVVESITPATFGRPVLYAAGYPAPAFQCAISTHSLISIDENFMEIVKFCGLHIVHY